MAIYAVGDVQGCCDELEALIHTLHIDPRQDELLFVGDLDWGRQVYRHMWPPAALQNWPFPG